jgi:hypothetical protein
MRRQDFLAIVVVAGVSLGSPTARAQSIPAKPAFSWVLPKTVVDVTITYQYASCVLLNQQRHFKVKIIPTIAARGVPDTSLAFRIQSTEALKADWSDRNLTITTFSNTHILNTVSAHPVGQAATIVGNVLTGIGKIAGIAFSGAFLKTADLKTEKDQQDGAECPDDDANPGHLVKSLKDAIRKSGASLATGTLSSSDQKQQSDLIQSLQTLLTQEQAKLSFSVKATIDPGTADSQNIQVGMDAAPPVSPLSEPPAGKLPLGTVSKDGLIASLRPSDDQLKDVPWMIDPSSHKLTGVDPANLQVTVVMDFAHSLPKQTQDKDGNYLPTKADGHANALTFRDPAYIPVLVWLGDPTNKLLLVDATLPFAQYGVEEVLPFTDTAFADVTWSMTFSDTGEQTNSNFTAKSTLAVVTSLFASTATTAGTVTSDALSANANKATLLQNQADAIYQGKRLSLCQADATSCPSK